MNIRAHISKAALFVLRASRLPFQQPTISSRYKNIPLTSKGIHTMVAMSLIATNFVGFIPTARQRTNDPDILKSMPNTYVSIKQEDTFPPRPTINRPEPRTGIRPEKSSVLQPDSSPTIITGQEQPLNALLSDSNSNPLLYIQNIGQFDPRSKFQLRGESGEIRLAEDAIWVTLINPDSLRNNDALEAIEPIPTPEPYPGDVEHTSTIEGVHLRLQFDGANPAPLMEGFNPVNTTVSYFHGQDPANWLPDVPVWGGVRYLDIFPGVNMEVAGSEGDMTWRFDIVDQARFILEDADHSQNGIELRVEGANAITFQDGNYYAVTDIGDYRLPGLEAVINDVPGSILNIQSNGSELWIPLSESNLAPIEPSMSGTANEPNEGQTNESQDSTTSQLISEYSFVGIGYSTYLGGSLSDQGKAIITDSSEAAYITGETISTNFPTIPGAFQDTLSGLYDLFVTKLSAEGNRLIYSTYIGGSSDDVTWDIGLDSANNAYIVGWSLSSDFPVTIGSSDTGAYVVRLNENGTGLVYSRFVGGSGGEQGFGIAVKPNGEAYIVGQTHSNDFPVTVEAYDVSYNGSWDGFVAGLDSSGEIVFATYLGGSNADCEAGGNYKECTIAIDAGGYIYISGPTYSADFPTAGNPYDSTYNGGQDGFIAKLNPAGSSLVYSTYFGDSQDECEQTCTIDISSAGEAFVAGSVRSGTNWQAILVKANTNGSNLETYTIPGMVIGRSIAVGDNGWIHIIGDNTSGNNRDVHVTRLITTTLHSVYLGGTNDEVGWGLDIDKDGSTYITGWTNSGDFPTTPRAYDTTGYNDAFVTKFGQEAYTIVDELGSLSSCGGGETGPGDNPGSSEECPTQGNSQGSAGDPINTRTGGFDFSVVDLSIPTPAGNLAFERSYSSLATALYTTTLGYGWTHTLDTHLIFPDDPGGQTGIVLFKAHSVNQYKFTDNGDGTYTAFPGVIMTLTRQEGPPITYQVTNPSQSVYTFDETGRLIQWADAQGFSWTYTYDINNRLDRVTDDTTQYYLDLGYDGQGRIDSVLDHTGRGVVLGYNGAGDLETVVDVLDETWTYTYDANHRIRLVTDPGGVIVIHNEYDAQGRAYQQYAPDNTLVLTIDYNLDGTTVITDALDIQKTDVYDSRKTFVGQVFEQSGMTGRSYDNNFRPTTITDENSNATELNWSADGANLTIMIDAESNRTDLMYDPLNNLTEVIDPRDFLTTYSYSGTLMISSTDALSNTTHYSYTTSADVPQPPGLLKGVVDPLGRVTQFAYNQFGQRTSTTDPNGVTNYEYDEFGRLIRTTYPSGRSDWTCYDAANRVVRVVFNASGDGGTPQTDPCDSLNYQPSADPIYDRISTTVYDLSDNMIAVIDPAGRITRTYYDANNRPVVVGQNLVGQGIEVTTPPDYDPNFPDQNVRSETVSDANGNVIASIDPLGKIIRTYFDPLNRPVTVTHNLVGQGIEVTTPPVYNPQYPDRNVSSQTVYDAAGNIIAAIDPEGTIVRTYYDAVNRPVTVVQNLVGQGIEVTTPPTYDPNYPDRNLRTDTVYDENSNAIASIDTKGTIVRTYYDALNRPETTVLNLVGQAIESPTPPTYNPAYPDRNLLTDYVYDAAGNLIATVDPAGSVTRTYFDQDNRPQVVVRNLYGQTIENPTPPAYDPDFPDRNVRTENVYDEYGRIIAAIDPLGHVTRTYYDSLDRPAIVVRNLSGQSIGEPTPPAYNPTFPDQNVRMETVYGQDGEVLAGISNDGAITRTYYDRLDRVRYTVQNLVGQSIENPTPPAYDPGYPDRNVRAETMYDAAGRAVKTIDTQGHVTHVCYDGLGRGVKTVLNPTVSDPCGSYTPSTDSDLDVTTVTAYDAVGNRTSVIDPEGNETTFEYDGVYRLTVETDPLQHTTSYTYDGAGNRVATTNARNIATRFEYDQVNRLTAVIENYRPGYGSDHETNVRTEYGYDAMGNRVSLGNARYQYTYFGYDGLNRPTSERDPLNHQTTYGYDASGNRVSLLDANGDQTSFGYDGLDRPALIDYPSPDADVSFTYDAAGNRASMSDGLGTTGWAYDELNRALAVTDPFSQTVSYGYNGLGQRTSITYPDTKVVTYTLDNAGRLHLVTGWDSLLTTYTYDKAGRLQSALLPNGVNSGYIYDNAGRLLSLSHTMGVETLSSFQYTYDPVGNRTSVYDKLPQTFPHNTGLVGPTASSPDYGGDVNGFESNPWNAFSDDGLFALDDNSGTNTSTDCTDAGKDKHRFYNFGLSIPADASIQGIEVRLDAKVNDTRNSPKMCVQLSWDAGSTWTGVQTTPVLATSEMTYMLGGSSDTWGHTWTGTQLNNANLHVRVINTASSKNRDFYLDWIALKVYYSDSPTITYTYDPLDRLTAADYSYGDFFHYEYDAVGNRLSEQTNSGTTTYAYDNANRLTSVNEVTYTWDNNGNLLNDGANTYSYDYANRLTAFSGAQTAVSYRYNGQGDRISQTAGITTTNYTLDLATGLTQVLADGTNTYLYSLSRIGEQQPGGWQYYLGDALGSVRQVTDAAGAVTLSRRYEPYGELLHRTGSAVTSFGFTGEWTDSYTNLVYLRARWYVPQYGRFTSQDTWQGDIQNPYSFNKWLYGYANPINVSDPSGRNPCALSGTCGPDVTDWFRDEMEVNYSYGHHIRTLVAKMKGHAAYLLAKSSRCEIVYLRDVAEDPPFTNIVSKFKIPLPNVNTPVGSIPVIGPDMADKLIDFLKLIEFGAYGLAVDYTNVKYDLIIGTCGNGCGQVINEEDDKSHPVVTLCDRCVDASDLGNIMFGLGGNARGYDIISTYFWAAMFNAARDPFGSIIDIPINALNSEDARGAFPGWTIGANHAYLSREAFCSVIDTFRPIGYNDNAEQIEDCIPCSRKTGIVVERPSSLISRGGGEDTINKLNELRDTFYQRLWEELIE
jgi:RHS repeat-associated protein